MFVVTEAEAAAIRTIYHERDEFSVAVELCWLFPGIRDTEQASAGVRANDRRLEAAAQAATPGEATRREDRLTSGWHGVSGG